MVWGDSGKGSGWEENEMKMLFRREKRGRRKGDENGKKPMEEGREEEKEGRKE